MKATAPAKLPVRVMVTVLVAEAPRTTVTLAGLAASVKFGAAFTVSAIVVVRARPPPVPVMVTVAGPSVAIAEAVNVTVDELPVVEVGLNVAVTPAGNPAAVRATAEPKPPTRAMLIAAEADAPRLTLTLPGFAASVKSAVVAPSTRRLSKM